MYCKLWSLYRKPHPAMMMSLSRCRWLLIQLQRLKFKMCSTLRFAACCMMSAVPSPPPLPHLPICRFARLLVMCFEISSLSHILVNIWSRRSLLAIATSAWGTQCWTRRLAPRKSWLPVQYAAELVGLWFYIAYIPRLGNISKFAGHQSFKIPDNRPTWARI